MLTDEGTRFVRILRSAGGLAENKHLTSTEYQTQTHGQAKCFNKTIMAMLQQYVAKSEQDWNVYMMLLTYVLKSPDASPYEIDVFQLGFLTIYLLERP